MPISVERFDVFIGLLAPTRNDENIGSLFLQ
jgi:hypothetical protein